MSHPMQKKHKTKKKMDENRFMMHQNHVMLCSRLESQSVQKQLKIVLLLMKGPLDSAKISTSGC